MAASHLFTIPVEQRKQAIDQLVQVSLLTSDYMLLLGLSVLIVVSGLHINSASVIIGGMVVAPLLSPIMAMALGIVLADFKLMRKAAVTLLISVVMVVAFSALMTLFFPGRGLGTEILERSSASLAHLIIASASGVLAAFAFAKPNISSTITGIAVSVALLPPIATTGIGVALANWALVSGSLTLFFVNFLGIVLAATVVFSLMGFYPVRRQAEVKLREEELNAVRERKEREIQKAKDEEEQERLERKVEEELKEQQGTDEQEEEK